MPQGISPFVYAEITIKNKSIMSKRETSRVEEEWGEEEGRESEGMGIK